MIIIPFIIADTHFYHEKLIRDHDRPFNTIQEMNNYIINKWNSVVSKDDLVFHLGDFALNCNKKMVKEIVLKLNGYIYLIEGNHDKRSKGWFRDCGIVEINKQYKMGEYILSHKPIENLEYGMINLHGHLHGFDKGLDKTRYIDFSCEVLNYTPTWIDWQYKM